MRVTFLSDLDHLQLRRGAIEARHSLKRRELLVSAVGWSEAPVLIQGETGSGKEVLARELHAHSPRAGQPKPMS